MSAVVGVVLGILRVGLCLMLMEPRTLVRMRFHHCLVCVCGLPIPVVLYSAAYWMWLGGPGNGEANFVFFQCLAYNIFLGIILSQFCSACVQRDKAVRMVRKEAMLQQQNTQQEEDQKE